MALNIRLKKEFSLAIIHLKLNTMVRMEDKITFLFMNVGIIIRIILVVIFFQAIYTKVNVIGGWSYAEVLVLVGTWELINAIAWATFFRGGFRRMPGFMRRGELDSLLVRPVNLKTYFIYDNNDILFGSLPIIFAVILIMYGASISSMDINLPYYLFIILFALIIQYFFVIILSSINFWTIVEQTMHLFINTMRLGRYPITIYKGIARTALTVLVPVACIYSFPVQALFGKLKITDLGIMFGVLICFYLLSNYIWNIGLRRYESTGY
ncbi:MAG: ABC-2 family transporter protein [Patescibacteria group bacterium]|nr:ABC-2 family transporter protein [Patescibacteria group bacterium]